MTESTLQHRLAAIAAPLTVEEQQIAVTLQATQVEEISLQLELQALQQRLATLHLKIDQLRHDHTQRIAQRCAEQLTITLADLQTSADCLINLSRIAQMAQQRAVLLTASPGLEHELEEFRAFEATRELMLQQVPASYHRALLDAHEGKRTQLTPLLDLEQTLASIPRCDGTVLQILVTCDPERRQIIWVLPFATTHASIPDDEDGVALYTFRREFIKTVNQSKPPPA